jgi:hypothetical protein
MQYNFTLSFSRELRVLQNKQRKYKHSTLSSIRKSAYFQYKKQWLPIEEGTKNSNTVRLLEYTIFGGNSSIFQSFVSTTPRVSS